MNRSHPHFRSAIALAIPLALALCAAGTHAAPWTAERVLDAVRRHDPSIRAARADAAASRAQASQMWGMLLPHVSLSSGFTRTDDQFTSFEVTLRRR